MSSEAMTSWEGGTCPDSIRHQEEMGDESRERSKLGKRQVDQAENVEQSVGLRGEGVASASLGVVT